MREERLSVRTTGGPERGKREELHGFSRSGRAGPIPERRLDPDGRLRRVELPDLPLELIVGSGSLGPGRWTTDLIVAGRSRLRVEHVFDGRRARIVDVDSDPEREPSPGGRP